MRAITKQVLTRNALSKLATFPGETSGEQAVYGFRHGAPAVVLVREPWNQQDIEAAMTGLATRLPALAERWGCPVAGLVSATLWGREREALTALREQARPQTILLIVDVRGRIEPSLPDARLSWVEPSWRSLSVPLPPFPLLGWPYFKDLPGLARELEASPLTSRRQPAREVALGALERLQHTPALLLIRDPDVWLAETARLITQLLPLLEPVEGRRYLLWALVYLGACLCFDPLLSQRSWPALQGLLETMGQRWEAWSTKEQRVIVRALQLLCGKGGEAGVPAGHSLWAELQRWADRFLDTPEIKGWRWSFRVKEFLHALAACRALPIADLHTRLLQHEERGRLLQEVLWTLAYDFWESPTAERWAELQQLFRATDTARDIFRRCVRIRLAEGPRPAFWRFLSALQRQGSPAFLHWLHLLLEALGGRAELRLSPEVKTDLRALLDRALQSQGLSSWAEPQVRQALEALGRGHHGPERSSPDYRLR